MHLEDVAPLARWLRDEEVILLQECPPGGHSSVGSQLSPSPEPWAELACGSQGCSSVGARTGVPFLCQAPSAVEPLGRDCARIILPAAGVRILALLAFFPACFSPCKLDPLAQGARRCGWGRSLLWELWPQLGWQLIPKPGQKQRLQSRKLQMAWRGECWREELLPARVQLQRAHGSLAQPRGRARRHPRDSSTPGRWHRTALGAQREGGTLQNSGKRIKRGFENRGSKGKLYG